jgi:undecaprenyl-diphosphatase
MSQKFLNMIEELLKYDTELFLFLNNLGSETWDGVWRIVTHKFTWSPLYVFLLYLVFRNYGLKPTILVILCAVLMITATDQLANVFKYGFERLRPCSLPELRETMRFAAVRCSGFGYFSAHAASAMAAAVFLGLLLKPYYKYLPFVLLFWAVLVAYSRIYLGVHYPLDIMTGMFFGGMIGWFVYRLQKLLRIRFLFLQS